MTEEKEKVDPIYFTRSAYAYGQGKTAMESFLNCFRNGSGLREFKIIKLPEGAHDIMIDDLGSVTWMNASKEKGPCEDVPFDADFLEHVKECLLDMLEDSACLMKLLECRDADQHEYPNDDLREIMEGLFDFTITGIKEA